MTARRVLWWVIFFFLTFLILATNFITEQVALKPGDIATKDVIYRGFGTVTYTSEIKTSEAKTQVARDVEQIYKVDPQVLTQLETKIDSVFQQMISVKTDDSVGKQDEQIKQLKLLLPENIPLASIKALLSANNETITLLNAEVKRSVRDRMESGVTQEQILDTQEQIIHDIDAFDIKLEFKTFLREFIIDLDITPNKFYDSVATAQEVEKKLAQVKPVQVTVRPNEKVIAEGTEVTPEQVESLQNLGLQGHRLPILSFIGLFGFVAIVYLLIIIHLNTNRREFQKQEANILLLGLLINVSLVIAKMVTAIQFTTTPELGAQVGYLIPISASSMLTAILLDTKLAVFVTIILGLFTGVITDGQIGFVIVAIIGGLVGVYSVSKLSQRNHLVRASLYIGLSNSLTIIAMGLMWNHPTSIISLGAMMGMINGILASILTIGLLPFLEGVFEITTSVKMLELSNPNHPLLKELMLKAPGTYYHSILVGNLAEAAADAVGADSLLVRVASYFHDIGKIKRPDFFIENQLPSENPHDKLAPTLSTLIITSHVKEGVELTKDHKLPKVITDIIEQHHGTSLLAFFYHKAKEGDKGENVLESDFRYQHPKPQTREAAIVMLADSVQAAVHALKKPTQGHLKGKVREIIKQKFEDGQLDECDLTFKDLDTIAKTFEYVLNGIFHNRIEYPDQVLKEIERGNPKNGTINKE